MNISKSITAGLSLGLITVLSGTSLAEVVGDPRVQVVELPIDSSNLWVLDFSGDGSAIAYVGESQLAWEIHKYSDDEWEIVSRSIGEIAPGPMTFGLSDDGSALVVSDYSFTSIYRDGFATFMPKAWNGSGSIGGRGRTFFTGAISGDGSSVGYSPSPGDTWDSKAALVWRGERYPDVLNEDRVDDDADYVLKSLSFDGQEAAGIVERIGQMNDMDNATVRAPWVYQDGVMIDIPVLDPGYDLQTGPNVISGSGEAVIANSYAQWAYDPDNPDDNTLGPYHAWIWTAETGTVEISDSNRFEWVSVWDITFDAQTVLGSAGYSNGDHAGHVLWTRDGGLVLVDDLFHRLGITIDADLYWFSQISSNGSKLMGTMQKDGIYSALIVTIPTRSKPLTMVQP